MTCIGYRKIGSGLVSVCFEGEISAIHTAIERGVEVAGAAQHVKSLVIARPEPSVVAALSHLKGRPEAKPVANHADMKNEDLKKRSAGCDGKSRAADAAFPASAGGAGR